MELEMNTREIKLEKAERCSDDRYKKKNVRDAKKVEEHRE